MTGMSLSCDPYPQKNNKVRCCFAVIVCLLLFCLLLLLLFVAIVVVDDNDDRFAVTYVVVVHSWSLTQSILPHRNFSRHEPNCQDADADAPLLLHSICCFLLSKN